MTTIYTEIVINKVIRYRRNIDATALSARVIIDGVRGTNRYSEAFSEKSKISRLVNRIHTRREIGALLKISWTLLVGIREPFSFMNASRRPDNERT